MQQALTASGARASIKDPALAELVRNEQDLGKQVSAQLGLLNNILALPSAQRDEKGVKGLNASIGKLRSDRDKARAEINKRFPSYADLVDPKPPSVAQIKATLADGEAMLSFYFGRDASFVWAVPKSGAGGPLSRMKTGVRSSDVGTGRLLALRFCFSNTGRF